MKSEKRPRKKISIIVTIVAVLVFGYSLYRLIDIGIMYYHNKQILTEVQEVYDTLPTEQADSSIKIEERKVRQQFIDLQEINEDIVGWISIEDTKINYPILQTNDNIHYLDRNYKEEYTPAGSIFMDYRNDVSEYDPNVVVYGHRMRDNSMFNSLTYFLEEDFFNNHGTIQFDTMYESYDAEVFAAYNTTTDFDYIQTDFQLGTDFLTLVHQMKQKSKFQKDIDIGMDDQIITLSTCDYMLDPDKGRLVVHAKLVKRE